MLDGELKTTWLYKQKRAKTINYYDHTSTSPRRRETTAKLHHFPFVFPIFISLHIHFTTSSLAYMSELDLAK